MKIALYARAATGRQAESDLSIAGQIKTMESYCNKKGWEIVSIYQEQGASGNDKNRSVFQDMIYEATKNSRPIDAILTTTTCRFFRDVTHSLAYKRLLKKSGVDVRTIKQEGSDSPMENMIESLLDLIDQYESEINALHTRRAMIENTRQGGS